MTVRVAVLPAEAWAKVVAGELAERVRAQPAIRLCLPTGDTPTPLYTELVAAEHRGEISFGSATLIMLDAWVGLPPGDPARFDARLRTELIDRLKVPPGRFIVIAADGVDPAVAAARHDFEARDLDLALLGLGRNGHVGFNEPGSRREDVTRVVRLAPATSRSSIERYGGSAAPTTGITVGIARLLEARECWLLVTGGAKAAVLRRALEGPVGPDCPASFLQEHARLTVFADEAAAAGLGAIPASRSGQPA
jgi:glucosamine-6-phosphate deaminase